MNQPSTLVGSLLVNAPIQKVFDFLTDPNKIPLVMPSLMENTNIPPLPLSPGATFNYKYQMFGAIFEGKWTVIKFESPHIYESETDNPKSRFLYELKEAGDGTQLSLRVEYEAPTTILEKLEKKILETMNQRECDTFIANLKTLIETTA